MKRINIEKILLWIIKTGLFLSLFLPFIVSKTTLFPYVFGKGLFFQVLIECLLPFWVALIWFWPKYRPIFYSTHGRGLSKSKWSWFINPEHGSGRILLNLSILAFFVALILSTLLGADPARSFWGTQERMTGVFTLLHFGLFYFMLISVFRSKKDWLLFLRGVILVGLAVSVWALYKAVFSLDKGRYGTTIWFGNPGITGSVLLFFVFLTPVWRYMERIKKSRLWNILITVFFVLTELIVLGAVLVNATRAVWVGLFLATIIGLLILSFSFKSPKFRIYKISFLSVAVVLMLLSALTIFGTLPSTFYERSSLLNRARSIASIQNNSRIMSWTQGLRALKSKHILFGYGPENYYIAHNKPFNVKVSQLRSDGIMLDFDKAHNQPLENLVVLGVIGFLAYLLIFVMIVWLSFKLPITNYQLPITLLFIAYFVHLLFTFDTPSSYWLFFISLGLVHHIIRQSDESNGSFGPSKDVIGAILITVLIIIIPISLYFINIKSYKASHWVAVAEAADNAGQPIETIFNFYYQALQYKPAQGVEIRKIMGMDVLDKIKEYKPEQRNILMYTAAELEKNSKNDYHSQMMLGTVYNLLGAGDQRYYNQALKALERAKKLAPSRYQIHTELYESYAGMGKFDKAKQSINKALELGFEPKTASQKLSFAFIYGQTGDLEKSLDYYQQALELEPANIKILGSIAALRKELGEIDKARETAQKILEIEPAMEGEVREFLEELKN